MKDKLQFPFKRNGGNYLELIEDLGKDTMLGVKTVRATTRNTAIYFDDDGYTIQDAKKLASAIQDTYSDVTATADFGRNPYGEEVPFVFVDKVNSFTRESKMKKLNITKEQFEKSKYFKNKYGKLEYVSESGRLFKTNKGKILKFKESSNTKDEPYSVYKFINTLRWDYNEYMLEEPQILGGPGDGWKDISIMCSKSQYRKMLSVVKKYCQKYGWEYQANKIDDDAFEIIVSEWDESTLTDDFRESTKKFGRKFNEGAYHDKHYLTIRDYDKLPDEEKANYVEPMYGIGMVVNLTDKFYKNTDMDGRMEPKTGWHIKGARYFKRSKIWDYYIVNDDSLGDGFWAEEDWICDEYDESTKKKFGRKSVKESVGDVSTDPAYVCPYCGGRNCSFEDADDSPLEGYFDGGTLNAQFYCNDCDKFYNVAYELKVKDVYPNEDADELSEDWA